MLSTFNAAFSIIIIDKERADKRLGKILLIELGKVQRRATGKKQLPHQNDEVSQDYSRWKRSNGEEIQQRSINSCVTQTDRVQTFTASYPKN